MAKEKAITVPGPANLPAHLRDQDQAGLDTVSENLALNRLKVVQGQSAPELKKQFGEGSVIIVPTNEKVADPEEPFLITPIIHWVSFEKWSDFRDQQSSTIVEQTMNRDSELARRAENPKLRTEDYGDDYKYSYVKSLNYIIELRSGSMQGEHCIVSWSKGDFQLGRNLNSMLKRRGTAIFNNQVELRSVDRQSDQYNWHGLNPSDPAPDNLYVGPEDSERLRAEYEMLAKQQLAVSDEGVTGGGD